MKDIRKCDSLRVSSRLKAISFEKYVKENLQLFSKLEVEQNINFTLQTRLATVNTKLIKTNKSSWLYGIGGTLLGWLIFR